MAWMWAAGTVAVVSAALADAAQVSIRSPLGLMVTDAVFASVFMDDFRLGGGNQVCLSISSAGQGPTGSQTCFGSYPREEWLSNPESARMFSTQLRHSALSPGDYVVRASLVDSLGKTVAQSEEAFSVASREPCPTLPQPRVLIDSFILFDELDVLELRFLELGRDVDYFVIVESDTTHSGKPKPLHLKQALEQGRFASYRDKIRLVTLHSADVKDPRWDTGISHDREKVQRDAALSAIEQLGIDDGRDVAVFSDADEIMRAATARQLKWCANIEFPVALQLDWYHYVFNLKAPLQRWGMGEGFFEGPLATAVGLIKQLPPSKWRRCLYAGAAIKLLLWNNAGWHLSRFGGTDSVKAKLLASANFAHHEGLLRASMNVADLVAGGIPILPPGHNANDGATLFRPQTLAAAIKDLPGGIGVSSDPRFAHMFSTEELASNPQNALWPLMEANFRSSVHSRKPVELFVVSGHNSAPAKTTVLVPCGLRGTAMANAVTSGAVEALVCRQHGLQSKLCTALGEAVAEACANSTAPVHELTLQVDPFATLQLTLVNDASISSSTKYMVSFAVTDNVTALANALCQELDMTVDGCAAFREHAKSMAAKLGLLFGGTGRLANQRSNERLLTSRINLRSNDGTSSDVTEPFTCFEEPSDVARRICAAANSEKGPLSDFGQCLRSLSTQTSRMQAASCSSQLEDWLDRPLKHFLRSLQWLILDESLYYGVRTWKFAFDLWMYQEILVADPPDILIEVGNMYGGSALYFARLFDTMGHHGRIIAVDIDHSNLDPLARAHPRITWVEGDALLAFPKVQELVRRGESVMLIEDASHTFAQTLEIMRRYSALVTVGSWMIIEDTVLHNGVENAYFNDPGAFASVERFMQEQPSEGLPQWRVAREMERFVVTWNPKGFLQRISAPPSLADEGVCDKEASNLGEEISLASLPLRTLHALESYLGDRTAVVGGEMLWLDLGHGERIPLEDILGEKIPSRQRLLQDVAQLVRAGSLTLCGSKESLSGTALDHCTARLAARTLAAIPEVAELPVLMSAAEMLTPLHVPSAEARAEDPTAARFYDVPMLLTRGPGVAVVPGLSPEEAAWLREAVVALSAFQARAAEHAKTQNRYLDILCASREEGCVPPVPELLSLVANEKLDEPLRRLLGERFLLDSTSLSVQWPGTGRFGPHVDRPFLTEAFMTDDWPYSAVGMPLPGKEYPLSVQVIVLLDNFTSRNGGFYTMGTGNAEQLRSEMHAAANATDWGHNDWFARNKGRVVTGRAGEIILAHGAAWHGALANYWPRPRIALLLQFVPRFVRPSTKLPSSVLSAVPVGLRDRLATILDIVPKDLPAARVQVNSANGPSLTFSLDRDCPRCVGISAARFGADQALARKLAQEAVRVAIHNGVVGVAPEIVLGPLASAVPGPPGGALRADRPRIAFGLGSAMGNLSPSQVGALVGAVLEAGYRALDLAEMYPNMGAVGAAFAAIWGPDGRAQRMGLPHRDQVHITSKVWATNLAPEHVEASLNATLKTLQLGYLDAWLVHVPVPLAFTGTSGPAEGKAFPIDESARPLYATHVSFHDTWRAMESVLLDGTARVRSIGVSNTPGALLHDLLASPTVRVRPAVNQIELHPHLAQSELRRACDLRGVPVQGYAPLASGRAELLSDATVKSIADRLGLSPADVLVAWSVAVSSGTVYSSRDLARARGALMAAAIASQLSAADVAALEQLAQRTGMARRVFNAPHFSFLWA